MSTRKQSQEKVRSSLFLICAAPIFVDLDDKDRVEQAARAFQSSIVDPKVVNDTFWNPFLAAKNSFDKMAIAIAEEHGWGLDYSRRMLAVAMGAYMDRWAPDHAIGLISSIQDDRLVQWCAAQLARAAPQTKEKTSVDAAMSLVEATEDYVRTFRLGEDYGNDSTLTKRISKSGSNLASKIVEIRQNSVNNGEIGADDIRRLSGMTNDQIVSLRAALRRFDYDGSFWIMLGAPRAELSVLAWGGPLTGQDEDSPDPVGMISIPYIEWMYNIFAYGYALDDMVKYANNILGENFEDARQQLEKIVRYGYIRAREVLKEALLTYPPPILSIR